MAIGESILDLNVISVYYPVEIHEALKAPVLNQLMNLGWTSWKVVRDITQKLLLVGSELDRNAELKQRWANVEFSQLGKFTGTVISGP